MIHLSAYLVRPIGRHLLAFADHPPGPPRHPKVHTSGVILIGVAFVLLPLFAADAASGGEVKWRTSYGAALRESGRVHKPMLVQIKASWCGPCRQMLSETYADKRVCGQVNDRFVPVVLDADRDEALVEAFRVEDLPSTFIVAPDRTIITRLTGYQGPEELAPRLAKVRVEKRGAPAGRAVSQRPSRNSLRRSPLDRELPAEPRLPADLHTALYIPPAEIDAH